MKTKSYRLECNGFDENLKVDYFDDGWMTIGHNIPSFYAYQQPVRDYFRRLFSMIWCAITNKQYSFFEIVILPNQLEEFKKWVAEL